MTIYLDTGECKYGIIIGVSVIAKSLGMDYCNALLWFYDFTDEDCTSAFKNKETRQSSPPEETPKEPQIH